MNESTEAAFIMSASEPEPHDDMLELGIITFKVIKSLCWKIWTSLYFLWFDIFVCDMF